jgi:penicillin-binding protein 1A
MREIHRGLPAKDFKRPETGVVDITVCAKSGQLLTPSCNEGAVTLTFLERFRPAEYCTYHDGGGEYSRSHIAIESMRTGIASFDDRDVVADLKMPSLDLGQLPGIPPGKYTAPVLDGALDTTKDEDDGFQLDLTLPSLDDFEFPAYNPLME